MFVGWVASRGYTEKLQSVSLGWHQVWKRMLLHVYIGHNLSHIAIRHIINSA